MSPLVLLRFLKSGAEIPEGMLSYLFAYQNGFFFKTVVAKT